MPNHDHVDIDAIPQEGQHFNEDVDILLVNLLFLVDLHLFQHVVVLVELVLVDGGVCQPYRFGVFAVILQDYRSDGVDKRDCLLQTLIKLGLPPRLTHQVHQLEHLLHPRLVQE